MNKNTFNQYLSAADFRGLFISEMLWNNPAGATQLPELAIDERTYRIEQIADRSGFQILQCQVDEIPAASICKKLDARIRKSAENYICIFVGPGAMHHLWVAPVKKVEKRDLVLVEYDTIDKAGFLFEKMQGLSFTLDDQPTIVDIIDKVQTAFLINAEKITKDFYAGFKKEHSSFVKFISGIDDHLDDKSNKSKQWYTSVMLNRLMFCYFIQKKGFLDGDVDYLRHKLEWTQQQEGEDRFFRKFYKGFLVNLFHQGLNAPRHAADFEDIYGRIPYLNGGMFDVHQIERDYASLDIADDAFVQLFDFFDKWHWHLDDRMTATGRDINPDVLGYIFEQYINDRAQMGAYYTKEDITEYIGRNTIVPYLVETALGQRTTRPQLERDLWLFLRDSGDRYLYDAMKRGCDQPLPEEIAVGLDVGAPNLLERRSRWNERTTDALALPTEIWRETIERRQRCEDIRRKIAEGEIKHINDFITYNLDIRQFVYDYLATTPNHHFVAYFYDALQHVTILDPTCGSGAFLFAALNILEPLYEICLNRMEEFHAANPKLFVPQLQEVEHKYRSNIQYFIYKSIILRNLYGVDIMMEATEIAKLRLFLKMVAVVDVNKREANLGLDPLPDIDFNIRCGNTLVGYATQQELERDLVQGDMFAAMEFKEKVNEEMDKVARTYDIFKDVQLKQTEDMDAFKRAKDQLRDRLAALNDLLNHKMFGAVGTEADYDAWLDSHQPFHWLAEFYEIIHGHGGFDVIIGNPPYVEFPSKDVKYSFDALATSDCGNLYGCCIERAMKISQPIGKFSFIVPVAITCSKRMFNVIKILRSSSSILYFSNYDDRPGKLFEMIEHLRACIIISSKGHETLDKIYSTKYNRWYTENRYNLFNCLKYVDVAKFVSSFIIPKFSHQIEIDINDAMRKNGQMIATKELKLSGNKVYYRAAGGGYFLLIKNEKSITYINEQLEDVKAEKNIPLDSSASNTIVGAAMSSSLFYWNYIAYTDCRNLQKSFILSFCLPNTIYSDTVLAEKGLELFSDYERNKYMKSTHYKSTGNDVVYYEYYPKKSKPIIDEIDKVLARHYGFTDEELDFIINYDIKYRMGDELNEDES